jgi:hypothetical protein
MIKENKFFFTSQNNNNIILMAYPPSLCVACSILAGFSFLKAGKIIPLFLKRGRYIQNQLLQNLQQFSPKDQ